MKVLAASLRVGFCDEWKRPLMVIDVKYRRSISCAFVMYLLVLLIYGTIYCFLLGTHTSIEYYKKYLKHRNLYIT